CSLLTSTSDFYVYCDFTLYDMARAIRSPFRMALFEFAFVEAYRRTPKENCRMQHNTVNTRRVVSRRDFLRLSTVASGVALLTACAAPAAAPSAAPQAETASDAAAPAADVAVTVSAWAHWEQGLQWLNDAMENYGFADEHPNIALEQ